MHSASANECFYMAKREIIVFWRMKTRLDEMSGQREWVAHVYCTVVGTIESPGVQFAVCHRHSFSNGNNGRVSICMRAL